MKNILLLAIILSLTACGDGSSTSTSNSSVTSVSTTPPLTVTASPSATDVEGTVIDKDTLKPIAYAKLIIGTDQTQTDASGHYSFSNIATINTSMTITADGYITQTIPLSLQKGGGNTNVSLQADSNATAADCFNPMMYDVGSSWKITTRSITDNSQTNTSSTVVLPETTYNNYTANDLQTTSTDSTQGNAISDQYFKAFSDHIEYYGIVSQSATVNHDYYNSISLSIPFALQLNVPYASYYIVDYDNAAVDPRKRITTFRGKETVTTPVGTFDTCKFQNTDIRDSPDMTQASYYYWTIASGSFKGLRLKDAAYLADGSVSQGNEAISITDDFK